MYDPAIDLIIRAVGNKEPYEKIQELINHALLPYIDEITREKRLKDLMEGIKKCKSCGLCTQPGVKAMPEGNTYSDIMLVGESAGTVEMEQHRPFVGPAGQLLNKMLHAASEKIDPRWSRGNLYLTNIVKGQPSADGKTRPPTVEEKNKCHRFLMEEIALVKPRIIICVGAVAAEELIKPEFKITEEQGTFFGDDPKKIAMLHPSYILRIGEDTKEGIKAKNACWQVLLRVNEFLAKEE